LIEIIKNDGGKEVSGEIAKLANKSFFYGNLWNFVYKISLDIIIFDEFCVLRTTFCNYQ
jgi:hypothetical protein